jgi:hypothetical protein
VVLSAALDTLVAVLVQVGEILPQFFVGGMHDIAVFNGGELVRQSADGIAVESIVVHLRVAKRWSAFRGRER